MLANAISPHLNLLGLYTRCRNHVYPSMVVMPVIPALKKLRQEDFEFKAN
jgi:hypothetical protein